MIYLVAQVQDEIRFLEGLLKKEATPRKEIQSRLAHLLILLTTLKRAESVGTGVTHQFTINQG